MASRAANTRVALGAVGVIAFMVGLTAAAVPLYQLFCQVTGYGGTTQRATAPSSEVLPGRDIVVRFNADVDSKLSWAFQPIERALEVPIGESHLAFYRATNTGDEPVVGTAVFNVTPHEAGYYFTKIHCFCFEEQLLQPGETVDMPVSFFVDPAILDDPNTAFLKQITLSYTFFISEEATRELRAAAPKDDGNGDIRG